MKKLLVILLIIATSCCSQTIRKNPYYCRPPETSNTPKFGYLYNWYAATDVRNIAPTGWHVPTQANWTALRTAIGGAANGGKLKETGTTYWDSPNTGATNEVGFNARGNGRRAYDTGIFGYLKIMGETWSTTTKDASNAISILLRYDDSNFVVQYSNKNYAFAIRLIKDDSTDPGTVTGNDGKVYPTIKIGTQVWTACNIAETKYSNGDAITKVTDNSAWAALTTEAYCAYDNLESNVFE